MEPSRTGDDERSTGGGVALPRVVVSACLLGERVRYDGRDKRDAAVAGDLAPHVELIPVCPEVECGLPVPRPPMHLVGDPPRMVVIDSGVDHTDRFTAWLGRRLDELDDVDPHGFVLKARSPSCGVALGGLFARAVGRRWPDRPRIEEGDVVDPSALERFFRQLRRGG